MAGILPQIKRSLILLLAVKKQFNKRIQILGVQHAQMLRLGLGRLE
jgi:hypothetical protein